VAGFFNRTAIRWLTRPENNLTRRANHRYIDNIARILKPAPGNWRRVFSLAGTRERAGMRRGLVHVRMRPLCDDLRSRSKRRSSIALGIGFAPEMIAKAIMLHILLIPDEGSRHDRVFDIAFISGPDRHRVVGGIIVSAVIIPLSPSPNERM
jgi:hypothetical protein